jgi:hypothetical protein
MSFFTFNRISDAEVSAGSVFDSSLMQKIKNNFENLKPEASLIVSGTSIDWSLSNVFEREITVLDAASTSFSLINIENGGSKSIIIKNTSGINKDVLFTGAKWSDSDITSEVLSNSTTIFTFVSNGGEIYATAVENMG